jgi:hypothetical protein
MYIVIDGERITLTQASLERAAANTPDLGKKIVEAIRQELKK